ncbi:MULTISPECIES: photosynthetic complex assembly protein PuhC [Pseudomonadota]|jgi:putative photosynthetic complex assembly protein|uniref:photosynthetic complex assembly protein PuhC n=1 Tax=Pseudomonadota TaxID=1224 RepID=UPI00076A9344|nr:MULTISPECIES: photosynthetic complex assembly protein PuhC [Pseudomonadota]MAF62338.1 phosphonoacetaldehyde methylase [Blastomonas sp.]MBA4779732.1 phosphonoacetaldehyde methylase [Blastomonas sp.]|tara:strand:- start:24275 stop:24781 length:507 start_codon:yes stop_codon:yes gene_type:complete
MTSASHSHSNHHSHGGHGHSHENTVPKGALVMACGVVLFTLALTGATQLGWIAPSPSASDVRAAEAATAVKSRVLRFADAQNGKVVVTDAVTGQTVHVYGEEGSGFIRGVLRGMGRGRHVRGIPMDAPYELNHWSDGSLSLTDTATNRVVELGAFGPTNRATFQALLK